MKDLNFFSIYQTNIKERKDDNYILFILGGVVAVIIFVHLMYTGVKSIYYYTEMKKLNADLTSDATVSQLEEAEKINDQIKLLNQYDKSLDVINTEAKKVDVITDELLGILSQSIPSDTNYTKFSSKDYELTIEGTTWSRASVAELEHNLKQYSQFKVVHVDKIEVGETSIDPYKYKLTCVLKEGE